MKQIVVAIDGPAGAGKSTAARMLAGRLRFDFLDTGAMYRCATLAALRAGLDLNDQPAVAKLVGQITIRLADNVVWLNDHDVTLAIRDPSVSSQIGPIADNREVRRLLSQRQRDWVREKRIVTEGRDQGTDVFPDAQCKIFLTASSEERARRRVEELAVKGIQADYQTILDQQNQRDREDSQRQFGGLRRAPDAIEVLTDGLSLQQVVDRLEAIVRPFVDGHQGDSYSACSANHPTTRHGD